MSPAIAEDFKTVSGKIYKDATISYVDFKVFFVELPKDVQERFHYGSATPTGKAVMQQRIGDAESSNHTAEFFDVGAFADRFAQKVEKKLDDRESIYPVRTQI